ncbi:hypothetical protein C8Q76DRAFT_844656 [Earliella scabrosa]|nr:hypothetical protein C8Q76DRAFT_844656 [Earliella scabrosa]
MHFSKTYSQLLLTLSPPELRESAIEYRRLKKIINRIVPELTVLRLSPDVLQAVISAGQNDKGKRRERYLPSASPPLSAEDADSSPGPRVIYELVHVADHPRLPTNTRTPSPSIPLRLLPHRPICSFLFFTHLPTLPLGSSRELIIPLASHTPFFRTLSDALHTLSANLVTNRAEFESTLHALTHAISAAARPSSSTSSYHAYSPFSSDPANISISSNALAISLAISSKSDLETWRQIFQLYVEADIFQGHQERFRGERDVQDAQARLAAFSANVQDRIASGALKLKLKQSRVALQTFMELNTFILDLRKFQHVTSEATRKILKKHAKRTAMPLSPDPASLAERAVELPRTSPRDSLSLSLSLVLVHALTETLLPIIPHTDDYSQQPRRTWTKERAAAEEEMQELGLEYRGCVVM